jgi:hypothetical protein
LWLPFSYGSWTLLTFYGSTYFKWKNRAVVIMEQVAMFFPNKFVIQWCRMKLKDICTTVTLNIPYIRSIKMSAPVSQSWPLYDTLKALCDFNIKWKINKSHRNDFLYMICSLLLRNPLRKGNPVTYIPVFLKMYVLIYSEQQLNGCSIKRYIMQFWFWRDQVTSWILFYI